MRVLGLDIGSRRIGVALSDPSGRIAMPLQSVEARPRRDAARQIAALIAESEVERVVVGLPLELNGHEGGAVRLIRTFVAELSALTSVEIAEWDERMTSVAAERALIESKVRRVKRREVIDQVAATFILQGYLDASGCHE